MQHSVEAIQMMVEAYGARYRDEAEMGKHYGGETNLSVALTLVQGKAGPIEHMPSGEIVASWMNKRGTISETRFPVLAVAWCHNRIANPPTKE